MSASGNDLARDALPPVSLVICAYNAGPYLAEAIASARAQTYPALEILVIDDGSTDGSVEPVREIEDPRLRVLSQPNRGKSASLNRALDEMRGELFALLDADDRCAPTRVERQVREMRADPELSAVFCGIALLIGGRTVAPRFRSKGPAACRADLEAMRMPGHDPSGMFRTSFARVVRFREELRTGQGYDFILRLGERWPQMRVVGECLYQYRVRPDSITRADPTKRIEAVYAVKRDCCARRGLPAPRPPERPRRYARRALDNNLAAQFIESVVDLRGVGRRAEALRTGLRCVALYPFAFHYYKALILAVLPLRVLRRLRPEEAAS